MIQKMAIRQQFFRNQQNFEKSCRNLYPYCQKRVQICALYPGQSRLFSTNDSDKNIKNGSPEIKKPPEIFTKEQIEEQRESLIDKMKQAQEQKELEDMVERSQKMMNTSQSAAKPHDHDPNNFSFIQKKSAGVSLDIVR